MLSQRPRDEDALLLSARERSERVVFIVLHADVLERVSHDREVRLPGPPPQADRAGASHQHGLAHGDRKVRVHGALLREVADPGAVMAPQVLAGAVEDLEGPDRKSTRLNSSHGYISYAVFCLKKKKKKSD